jgi:hypothetical protein
MKHFIFLVLLLTGTALAASETYVIDPTHNL